MGTQAFATFVVRARWFIIVVFTLIVAFFALQLPKSQLDTEMKNQLPPDLPTRINLGKIEELFGGTDMAMLVLTADDILQPSTLKRLEGLSTGMKEVEECERVVSAYTAKDLKGEGGDMVV